MAKSRAPYGPIKFTITTSPLRQWCLNCKNDLRKGLVWVRVKHADGTHALGASSAVMCPECEADMTHVSVAFFTSSAEAFMHVSRIIDRLCRNDQTLELRLAGYEPREPLRLSLQ